ncbi:MAG TPA: hypothetical protein VMT20_09610 [Terriglobia bacterium]|nr:hypothetical protein [Terriglobia bacterium]
MCLRRSPQLTPASLAARRANALRSTGPRTAAGKARSCLNALRHGRRARDLRAKLARTGDSEAVFLLDWFHHHMLWFWRPRKERTWRYTVRLAARAWCFMTGLGLRPRAGETQEEADRKRACPTYRYGDAQGRPERPEGLRIGYRRGPAIKFLNPTPTRRKHLLLGWLPEFQHVPGPPRKAKRVRRVGPERGDSYPATRTVDSRSSLWRGQTIPGNDLAGVETPFHAVIPAEAAIHESSYKLPPPIEGGIKNLVQTKLECAAEAMTCQDSGNPWGRRSPEAVIAPWADGLRSAWADLYVDRLRGDDIAELEIDESDDDDSEVLKASRALIELQWSNWRQAITESKPSPDQPPKGGGCSALMGQSM